MGIIGSLTDREYQKFHAGSDDLPAVRTFSINQLVPEEFDTILLSYTGDDLTTVTYKIDGTGGTTVTILSLGYTAGNLTSIEKT